MVSILQMLLSFLRRTIFFFILPFFSRTDNPFIVSILPSTDQPVITGPALQCIAVDQLAKLIVHNIDVDAELVAKVQGKAAGSLFFQVMGFNCFSPLPYRFALDLFSFFFSSLIRRQ